MFNSDTIYIQKQGGTTDPVEDTYFSHGRICSTDDIPHTLEVVYTGGITSDVISFESNQMFSLIPTSCSTIGEVITYINEPDPSTQYTYPTVEIYYSGERV
jgi:hypothetical protein